ncbi:polyprenyl synthetase family protein [Hydrogenoanaerobacterium saccharovorans]|uniref:Polyprenyl synthetase family protein n=1 Tax=Hydrogenoanaerobacterium saccharovorans TaxID=474960 RepID=A0ABS2GPZ7_9FIRM|nr:farnesyl diphosphate synthase [Hydrogenoanaerobacterium saccharovorans]MBM6923555.1 polyprenyl synthetase family protein [Hydrogenoanaerobacterium saccharovorans]
MNNSLQTMYIEMVEKALDRYVSTQRCNNDHVLEAMRYSVLGGGKRIRALLVLNFNRILGGAANDAMEFAAAIEMMHAYSLIHDDLPCMDDDDLRRGKPSCHVAFGEAVALLAGDALQTLAFETLARNTSLEPAQVLQAVRELAAAAGSRGMVGGQTVDIEGTAQTVEQLTGMCMMKTGALIKCAVRLGCLSVGADEASMAQADIYADAIGLAFQIRDDILDVIGSTEELGKPVGSDAEQQKATFATVLGTERAQSLAEKLTRTALDALKQLNVAEDDPLYEMTVELCSRKK